MDESEYLLQHLIKDRLREAQARRALNARLREWRPSEAASHGSWARRLGLGWHVALTRAAQLLLPKPLLRL